MKLGDRRLGRFSIAIELISEASDVVRRIMGEVIVLRAEAMLVDACIEYEALCPAFEPLKEGLRLPEYDIVYDADTDQLSWVRQQEA
ncbi:hypothetical protein [Sinorhizobium fredii]|uniref:hypothetical protein n=1 Tax=Rhizobium fredii TaxID=380 RepID=UPI0012972391|nr:hypothetical protein [Sinorhizobium fredii]MQW94080.1 hypothetical protein [Sinorhizobium fredii]